MNRRKFLKLATTLSGLSALPYGMQGWAASNADIGRDHHRLVVIFLRGAVDGLNIVVPYKESAYYDNRPRIAIPHPRISNGALDLDGEFGLHPALAVLMPLWQQKNLAFVHACGSPDPTRSHFDAQDYMESGTPGVKSTADGWMNRLLAVLGINHTAIQALNMGPTLPRILSGKMNVATLPLGGNPAKPMALDRPLISSAFDRLYDGNDTLSAAYREGQAARQQLLVDLQQDMEAANNGAPSPRGFANDANRLAQLLRQDPRVQLVFLALGGWDTHVNQGAAHGQLANHLQPLGEGLAALTQGLGPVYQDTTILVISEFGRTMRENGNGGTDHGHGNVMWVLGGKVAGGKVYGEWPGLGDENLYEGRDLAITTDFRQVIGAILERHLRLSDNHLHHVFPDMPQHGVDLHKLIRA